MFLDANDELEKIDPEVRHVPEVPHGDLTIEIDIFNGQHEGIVVAEIEFPDEGTCSDFVPPAWLGEEVTHDPAYRNTTLAVAGFSIETSTSSRFKALVGAIKIR